MAAISSETSTTIEMTAVRLQTPEGSETTEPVAEPACGGRFERVPQARRYRLPALLRACRPRQQVKNLLVIAAPGAAGVLTHQLVAERVAVAFACFCLLSSATYLLNDMRDRREDARHPRRRLRPIAAGELSVAVAVGAAIVLALAGLGAAFAVSLALGGVGAGYLALTLSYSVWLRKIAVADLVTVSACFVLRAMAGGAATGVPVSKWFIMVTCFGALFLVSGKRYAELRNEGVLAATRASLREYSESYLRFVMILAAAVSSAAYCLWAFHGKGSDGLTWYEVTIVPFVLWLLRYGLLIDQGAGQSPEELVLGDSFLLAVSALWVALFACAVYVGT